jgi:hypothetical protein
MPGSLSSDPSDQKPHLWLEQLLMLLQAGMAPIAADLYAENGNGLQGTLTQSGSGTMPMLGPDIQQLSIQVERVTPDILHCKIGAPNRWEVPKSVFNAPNMTGIVSALNLSPL